jgi:hypothetical protein
VTLVGVEEGVQQPPPTTNPVVTPLYLVNTTG